MDADVVWDGARGWIGRGHTERGGLTPWYAYSAAALADLAPAWWERGPMRVKHTAGKHRGKYGRCRICGGTLDARSLLAERAHAKCLYANWREQQQKRVRTTEA